MVERLMLLMLVVFAVLAIQQRHLRVAVMFLSFFSLLCSVIYLFDNAPDVAMAEAAIGSTIAIVLFLVTLRKQEWIRKIGDASAATAGDRNLSSINRRRFLIALGVLVLAVSFFYLYDETGLRAAVTNPTLADAYRASFLTDTGSHNAVTAIYLRYRVYDTFFETLMLLVSVMGVVFFSRYQLHAEAGILSHNHMPGNFRRHLDQHVTSQVIGLLYPFVFMVGAYIILNGHLTPGGGFQGGAVLSAVLIIRYLSMPQNDIRIRALQTTEKLMFILIVLVPALYLFAGLSAHFPEGGVAYLVLMNILIGIKVSCGISIIFYRFVFFESR